jgi:hypothetical protein
MSSEFVLGDGDSLTVTIEMKLTDPTDFIVLDVDKMEERVRKALADSTMRGRLSNVYLSGTWRNTWLRFLRRSLVEFS